MQATIQTVYGAPDVLSLQERPLPTVGAGDLLIEVRASAVTQGDRRLRAADFPPGIFGALGRLVTGLLGPRNTTPGTTFAGRVVEVGTSVTRYKVGEDVFGLSLQGGTLAEFFALPEDGAVAPMPSNLSYEQAATLPYGPGTAMHFLDTLAQVKAGESVLVIGASGGVGRSAVQLAHHRGAQVTAVASRDHAQLRAMGARHTLNYKKVNLANTGARYDVILDTSGAAHFAPMRRSLTERGRFLSLYMTLGLIFQMLWTARQAGPKAFCGVFLADQGSMLRLRDLAEQGAFAPIIDSRYPLAKVVEAHARLEGRTSGAVVVTMGTTQGAPGYTVRAAA